MKKRKTKPTPLHLQVKFLRQSVEKLWLSKALQEKINALSAQQLEYQAQITGKQKAINQNVFKVISSLNKLIELKDKQRHSTCDLFLLVVLMVLFCKVLGLGV